MGACTLMRRSEEASHLAPESPATCSCLWRPPARGAVPSSTSLHPLDAQAGPLRNLQTLQTAWGGAASG